MAINFKSLVTKIIFFGAVTAFLSLSIFSFIILVNQHSELSRQIIDKGLIYSKFSAQSFYDDYSLFYSHPSESTFSTFKERAEERLSLNPDIVNFSLFSANGRVLFDSSELLEGKYSGEVRTSTDKEVLELLKDKMGPSREIKDNGSRLMEFYVPIEEISGSHIFVVRFVLSFTSLDKQFSAMYRQVGISFILVFILVLILSVPLYSSITRPLKHLSALTKKIRGGDLSVKMEMKSSGDEIGLLAEDFNTMVEDLRLERDKSSEYSKKLEKDIEDKAEDLKAERNKAIQKVESYEKELGGLKSKNQELEKLNKFMVDREVKMIELKEKLKEKT